jgi:hypothetical protein
LICFFFFFGKSNNHPSFRNGEGIEYLENPNQFDAKTLQLPRPFEIKSEDINEMSFSNTFQKKRERRKAANPVRQLH